LFNKIILIFSLIISTTTSIYSEPQFTELNRFGNGYNSHCIALADFNGDNRLDVAVGNVWDEGNQLYVNTGELNFDSISLFGSQSTRGMAWGDYNNDGLIDLAVANDWGESNLMYIQVYPSVFAFLPIFGTGNSYAISWADYDNDGDIDAAIINGANEPKPNILFKNLGDANFEEMRVLGNGCSRCGIWGDYDNDGKPDFAVAQREDGMSIFHNEGNDIFTEIVVPWPSCICGLSWGDYDNDGDLDLAVATLLNSTVDILKNNNGTFEHLHIANLYMASGIEWLDFDLDGDLDITVGSYDDSVPAVIYENQGDTIFTRYNLSGPLCIMSLTVGDIDNDGDVDICVPVYYDTLQNKLFRNNLNSSNYIKVTVEGRATQGFSNFCGIGTKVRIFDVISNEMKGFREIFGGGIRGSMSAMEAIFGVSPSDSYNIVVEWPTSGIIDSVKNVTSPCIVHIIEGQSMGVKEISSPNKQLPLSIYPNPGKNNFHISYTLEKTEKTSLNVYDISGRLVEEVIRKKQCPGMHTIIWNVKKNNSLKEGVYFLVLEREQKYFSKKFIVLR